MLLSENSEQYYRHPSCYGDVRAGASHEAGTHNGHVPQGAIDQLNARIQALGNAGSRNIDFAGESYPVCRVEAAATASNQLRRPEKRGARSNGKPRGTSAPRKQPKISRNAQFRLINILMSEDVREEWMRTRHQAGRDRLDRKELGADDPVWQKIHRRLLDDTHNVRSRSLC